MKATLQPGLSAETTFTVEREQTIDFMGEAARVYATPMLVRDLEVACRNLLLAHLDAGEDSVGTRVEIDHIDRPGIAIEHNALFARRDHDLACIDRPRFGRPADLPSAWA